MAPLYNGESPYPNHRSRSILNDRYADRPQGAPNLLELHQFSQFPVEIASAIWKLNLQYHRIIESQAVVSDADKTPARYATTNKLGNTISGKPYYLKVHSPNRHSPILSVNRYSRQIALEYYRLHMPYDFHRLGERHSL